MALKPCRECGEDVSTEAKTCPHCGVKKPILKSDSQKMTKILIWLFMITIIAVGIVAIISLSRTDENIDETELTMTERARLQALSARMELRDSIHNAEEVNPPSESRSLSARVVQIGTSTFISIYNDDTFDWIAPQIVINPPLEGGGFKHSKLVERLRAGESLAVYYKDLVNNDGVLFNGQVHDLSSIAIECSKSSGGSGQWLGKWNN